MKYHAHVYWGNSNERKIAMRARASLEREVCSLGRIWDKPIGPHPLPMYQVMYDSASRSDIEPLLASFDLSILLHEDIGVDHVRDHTDGARWLGNPLALKLDFLRSV